MGKIVLTLEVVMDRVRASEVQTLDVTVDEISLAIVQLGSMKRDLLKERENKRRMEAMEQW